MEHHISGNGAAGAGAGEGMVSGFDFDGAATHSHSHYNPFPTLQYPPLHLQPQMHVEQGQSQHLYNAIPAIQEQHGGMMDLSSSSSPTNLGQYTHSDEYQKFERGLSSPAALAPAFTQHRQQQQLHQGSAGMTHLQGSTSIEAASMTSPSTSTSVADPLTRLTDLGRNSGSGGTDELQKMGDADRERQRERVREKERNPERERGNSKEKDKEKGKDKDRKHTKKTYPAVGIRVRDRASNPLLQRRQPEVSASTTTAETVRAYQEQQKKLAAAAAMAGGQGQGQGAGEPMDFSEELASLMGDSGNGNSKHVGNQQQQNGWHHQQHAHQHGGQQHQQSQSQNQQDDAQRYTHNIFDISAPAGVSINGHHASHSLSASHHLSSPSSHHHHAHSLSASHHSSLSSHHSTHSLHHQHSSSSSTINGAGAHPSSTSTPTSEGVQDQDQVG
ncbi:hypothetical protein NLJ89_g12028 [Agrocybe chaxingu]|uniref:Uncharacterized protein n=1 Tax=Agrocybe chaxingu TaxID=84603 RepID=A0A9W8MMI4_9AGAR|nr:hypothetical protein NLJ89_g12028 [Agrocybe chaxingu]